jgi:hypothetical protein
MVQRSMGKNITITSLLLVIIVLLFLVLTKKEQQVITSEPIVTIHYDSVPYEVIKPVPYPVRVIDTVRIPADVDTMAILADYFLFRIYVDTIINTADLKVTVVDSVHQNRLFGRRYAVYQNFRPIEFEVECPPPPKIRNEYFVGVSIMGAPHKFGMGPSVGVNTREYGLYTYNYDIVNNTHQVSMFGNIKLRRR